MNKYLILTLFSLASCSFLRNLVAVTEVSFGDKNCWTSMGSITLTFDAPVSGEVKLNLESQVKSATTSNHFEYKKTVATEAAAKTVTLEAPKENTPTPLAGDYKVKTITVATAPATISETDLTVAFEQSATVKTGQTTDVDVDADSTDKKTFKVEFEPAFTTVPKIYANTTATTAITCTAADDKKSVTCTPTLKEMDNGEHKVAVAAACDGAKTEIGFKVNFVSSDSSSFLTAKIALLIGLFLL
jgi:hypothetical protein